MLITFLLVSISVRSSTGAYVSLKIVVSWNIRNAQVSFATSRKNVLIDDLSIRKQKHFDCCAVKKFVVVYLFNIVVTR